MEVREIWFICLYWLLGHEHDDYRLMMETDDGRGLELNNPGLYPSTCIELVIDGLAVTTILQAGHINDYEGASGSSISFDYAPQVRPLIPLLL